MKHFSSIVLAVALAVPAFAQATKTNAVADVSAPGQTLLAAAATLTAPLVLTNDYLCLTNDSAADVASGGKAVFSFSITNAGNYVFEALVTAPDDNSNSFFLNVDAMPTDEMIWDFEIILVGREPGTLLKSVTIRLAPPAAPAAAPTTP